MRSRAARVAALALLSALAFLSVGVATHPLWLAPWMSSRLSATSGRSVRIDSIRVGFTLGLQPVVTLRGVRIANADWADPGWPLADLQEAIALVSWRSIAERRPVIEKMTLRDGRVDLERQADGLRNWRLRDPEDRGPGRYKVLSLEAERSAVRFVHRGIDLVLEAQSTAEPEGRTNHAGDALPTHLEFRGEWRRLPFTVSVASARAITFLETGVLFGLAGGADAAGTRLDLDGRAGDLFREPLLDADVSLAGDRLAPFRAFIGPRHDGQGKRPFRIAGHARAGDRSFSLEAMKAKVGGSDFAGSLSWSAGGADSSDAQAARRLLRATLVGESVDVADVEWLAGHRPTPAAARAAEQAAAKNAAVAAAASTPTPAKVRQGLDAEIDFTARRLRWERAPMLQRARFQATWRDDVLAVPALAVGIGGGEVTGSVHADTRRDPPIAEADLRLRGLRIESLLPEQGEKKRVTGIVDAHVALRTSGDAAPEWLAALAGTAEATLRDGSLSALLDAEIGLQGGRILRSMMGAPAAVPIRCAAVAVDFRAGQGRTRTLVLDTARTATSGSGSVDLKNETFDVVLTPEAKESGVMVIDRSIRLHGDIRKPARELVPRVAPASGASASTCRTGSR